MSSSGGSSHLVGGADRRSFTAGGTVGLNFCSLWPQKLFQMSQYLLGNGAFSPKTFVNETNTFYQHVDGGPDAVMRAS